MHKDSGLNWAAAGFYSSLMVAVMDILRMRLAGAWTARQTDSIVIAQQIRRHSHGILQGIPK